MEFNKHHQLCQLAEVIDWKYLESRVNQALHINDNAKFRLITGLLYVKCMGDLSSEEVLERWMECVHLRYFCGWDLNRAPEVMPCSPGALDMWDREYAGKPYDAMTYALFRANVCDKIEKAA